MDAAIETDDDLRIGAATRIESLLSPQFEQFLSLLADFTDEGHAMSVQRLRHVLQLEDHLDWLLRHDSSTLIEWRRDQRRTQSLACSHQIAGMWQMLGTCLGRYALEGDSWDESRGNDGLLALTIAVALHCHVNEMRWCARAEQPCDMPMKALHRLYEIAEQRGIAQQRVHPYEADVDFAITPQDQYLQMLLMADLAERALPPAQRLIAQHWIAAWANDVALDAVHIEGRHSLEVNLAEGAGIQRIGEVRGSSLRYLDIRAIARHIEFIDALLANSEQADQPVDLDDATEEDFAATLAWLEKLYHDRSASFRAARERQVAEPNRFARVVVGWSELQRFIDAATWPAKSGRGTFPSRFPWDGNGVALADDALPVLDSHFLAGGMKRDAENFPLWRVRDVSAGGYGLSSTAAVDEALAVGTLLLLEVQGEGRWHLARMVRKFKSLDEAETRFGVELLGVSAAPVRLTPRTPEGAVQIKVMSATTALMLSRRERSERQDLPETNDLMLMSTSAVAYSHRFELKDEHGRQPIRTIAPVHSAGAWVVMQCAADDRDSSAAA